MPTLLIKDVSGEVRLRGNVTQPRDKDGVAKAIVYVNGDGALLRCYNGITGAAGGNCGFSSGRVAGSGWYYVNLGFPISDRFWFATVSNTCCKAITVNVDLDTGSIGSEALYLRVQDSDNNYTDRPVMLVVY